jgi:hypothetical protein
MLTRNLSEVTEGNYEKLRLKYPSRGRDVISEAPEQETGKLSTLPRCLAVGVANELL